MSAYAMVTIGTEDVWAPPKPVLMDLSGDLVISNLEEVGWEIYDRGEVTRAAIRAEDGWIPLLSFPHTACRRGNRIVFPPGRLRLSCRGEFLSSVESEQIESGQPALFHRKRRLLRA